MTIDGIIIEETNEQNVGPMLVWRSVNATPGALPDTVAKANMEAESRRGNMASIPENSSIRSM